MVLSPSEYQQRGERQREERPDRDPGRRREVTVLDEWRKPFMARNYQPGHRSDHCNRDEPGAQYRDSAGIDAFVRGALVPRAQRKQDDRQRKYGVPPDIQPCGTLRPGTEQACFGERTWEA